MRLCAFLIAVSLLGFWSSHTEAQDRQIGQAFQKPIDCTCRYKGRDVHVGDTICMQRGNNAVFATCSMTLNNTAWSISSTSCAVSRLQSPAKTQAVEANLPDLRGHNSRIEAEVPPQQSYIGQSTS